MDQSNFSIEITKTGKPHILYKNYKYRLSYKVRNGDHIWRCLGSACKATVRTDECKKTLLATNDKHAGPHPMTLRKLSSSSPRPTTPTADTGPPSPSTPTTSTSPTLATSITNAVTCP